MEDVAAEQRILQARGTLADRERQKLTQEGYRSEQQEILRKYGVQADVFRRSRTKWDETIKTPNTTSMAGGNKTRTTTMGVIDGHALSLVEDSLHLGKDETDDGFQIMFDGFRVGDSIDNVTALQLRRILHNPLFEKLATLSEEIGGDFKDSVIKELEDAAERFKEMRQQDPKSEMLASVKSSIQELIQKITSAESSRVA